MAIRGERVVAVGSTSEMRALAGMGTRVVDLHRRFAMPGFNDAHIHLESGGEAADRQTAAHTGRYIGSDGRVLKIQDLQNGVVGKDIANPIFAGLGDATTTDIPRTFQLSVRFRWWGARRGIESK